jgi:hypothetical protein
MMRSISWSSLGAGVADGGLGSLGVHAHVQRDQGLEQGSEHRAVPGRGVERFRWPDRETPFGPMIRLHLARSRRYIWPGFDTATG